MKRIYTLSLLFLAACTGNGSEIGPVVPELPGHVFSGQVLAADGSPIVGAAVSLSGSGVAGVSDRWGRFRLPQPPYGDDLLIVDARTGAANGVGEAFPKIRVPATVNASTPHPVPLVLPNLADAANQAEQRTVAVGSALGAGDNLVVSGAGLTLTLNGAQVDWTTPADHAGETQVSMSVAILPSHQSPVRLEVLGTPILAALVFWLDPEDVNFTVPASLSYTSGFFPNGQNGVVLFRYDPETELWTSSGAASVAGGVVTVASGVSAGGLHALGVVGCGSSTTISGRVLDAAGDTLAGALVTTLFGASAVSAVDGTFSIASVCAADGTGAALAGAVTVYGSSTQVPARVSLAPTLVASGTTDLGDTTLRTQLAGEIHFLVVQEGLALPFREVSVGCHDLAFGARKKTDASGLVDFFDVPFASGEVFQVLTAVADPADSPISVDSGGFFFSSALAINRSLYTGPTGGFTSSAAGSSVLVTVLREDSDAPIENAFVMVGTDPATTQKGWTNSSGQIQISVPASPTITAGVRSSAPAGWGSGGYDLVRKTAYRTVRAVNSSSLVIRLPVAERLDTVTSPYDAFGRVAGSISLATNPTVTAPVNGSGTYAIDLRGSPAGDPRQLFSVLGERSDFDALTPAGTDASAGYSSGGAFDASFTIDAPAPRAFLAAVERDSASASSGLITKFGVSGVQAIAPGASVSGSIALDQSIGSGTLNLTLLGLESALSPPSITMGVETAGGLAALLGDASAQLSSFNSSSGAGTLAFSNLTGSLLGGAFRFRVFGSANSGGVLRRQDVFLRVPGTSASETFLAVPELTTPVAAGTFDPTGAGVVWTEASLAQLYRIQVTFSENVTESGVSIRDDFDWQVLAPTGVSSAIFPTLPITVSEKDVPQFFGSGKNYTIEARALRASGFSYGPFLANTARVRLSDLDPVAESRYSASATTP